MSQLHLTTNCPQPEIALRRVLLALRVFGIAHLDPFKGLVVGPIDEQTPREASNARRIFKHTLKRTVNVLGKAMRGPYRVGIMPGCSVCVHSWHPAFARAGQ